MSEEKIDQLARDNPQAVAVYRYYDANGYRVHQWGSGDSAKFAVGNGPIEDIDLAEAERLVGHKLA